MSTIVQSLLTSTHQQYIDSQYTAIIILASWGILNAIVGGILAWRTRGHGRAPYFWQVCIAWGVVNAIIAIPQIFALPHTGSPATLAQGLQDGFSQSRFLAGFWISDFATILVGVLWLSRKVTITDDRWQGFGAGLVLQGGFLAIFDIVLLTITNNYYQDLLKLIGM